MTGCAIYATSARLIKVRGKDVTSYDYPGLAGVRESTRYNVWLILCGVAFIAVSGLNSVFPAAGAALQVHFPLLVTLKVALQAIQPALHALDEPQGEAPGVEDPVSDAYSGDTGQQRKQAGRRHDSYLPPLACRSRALQPGLCAPPH